MDRAEITRLINAWRGGDAGALDQLMPYVYDELRRLARGQMRGESSSHTLQATALVNEAFLRLADIEIAYNDRSHFLAIAARTMRRVLVDHARRKKSAKRGGGQHNTRFNESIVASEADGPAILELNLAVEELARVDESLAQVVELVFFGGLTYEETATVLGKSKTAVFDDVRLAKSWLRNYMDDDSPQN